MNKFYKKYLKSHLKKYLSTLLLILIFMACTGNPFSYLENSDSDSDPNLGIISEFPQEEENQSDATITTERGFFIPSDLDEYRRRQIDYQLKGFTREIPELEFFVQPPSPFPSAEDDTKFTFTFRCGGYLYFSYIKDGTTIFSKISAESALNKFYILESKPLDGSQTFSFTIDIARHRKRVGIDFHNNNFLDERFAPNPPIHEAIWLGEPMSQVRSFDDNPFESSRVINLPSQDPSQENPIIKIEEEAFENAKNKTKEFNFNLLFEHINKVNDDNKENNDVSLKMYSSYRSDDGNVNFVYYSQYDIMTIEARDENPISNDHFLDRSRQGGLVYTLYKNPNDSSDDRFIYVDDRWFKAIYYRSPSCESDITTTESEEGTVTTYPSRSS